MILSMEIHVRGGHIISENVNNFEKIQNIKIVSRLDQYLNNKIKHPSHSKNQLILRVHIQQ